MKWKLNWTGLVLGSLMIGLPVHGQVIENEAEEMSVTTDVENREPESPQGRNYEFKLADIQEASRQGVKKAWEQIRKLERDGTLRPIAEEFYQHYRTKISLYNNVMPQTDDVEKAFRTDLIVSHVLKAFADRHPGKINEKSEWFFNQVGYISANTILLYCSTDEYIVIWGTSLESNGAFSGYYPFMNEFDVMISGEMFSHDVTQEGHASLVYKPAVDENGQVNTNTVDTSNLKPGNVRSYTLKPYTYMVSYAQGSMVKAFAPGVYMPGVFVTQDWKGMGLHFRECYNSMVQTTPALQKLYSCVDSVSCKFDEAESWVRNALKLDPKKPKAIPASDVFKDNYRPMKVIEEYYHSNKLEL